MTGSSEPLQAEFAPSQATLLSCADTGSGTALSLTVILIVSESEQYLTAETSTPFGRQSEESSKEMSCPDLVICFPEHVNPMIPSPEKSKEPAPSAKSLIETVTVSVRPSAPPSP